MGLVRSRGRRGPEARPHNDRGCHAPFDHHRLDLQRSIKAGPGKHSRDALARFTYTLSEDASFRVVLKSLAKTKNRRHRDFGRYLHRATLDKGVTPAGTHTFVIDRPGWGREPGSYQLIVVARDDAGYESVPARAKFSIARR